MSDAVLRGMLKLKLYDEIAWLMRHGYQHGAILEALVDVCAELVEAA